MKFLKRFVLLILILVLILIGIGYLLPDKAHVERNILIDAPPEVVYPYVSNFHKFKQWSPWAHLDADIQYTYSGPDAGVGARLAWHSPKPEVGSGNILIVQSDPPTRMSARLHLSSQGPSVVYFTIEPAGDGSRVTWGLDTQFGYNLLKRYLGVMFERWVGGRFHQGLQNLKTLVESKYD